MASMACGAPAVSQTETTVPPSVKPTAKSNVEQIADAMCACTTDACLVAVNTRIVAAKPEQVERHKLRLVACFRKAAVFAAAALVPRVIAVADSRCACKSPDCAPPIQAKVQALRKVAARYERVFSELPRSVMELFDQATAKLARCSGDKLSIGVNEEPRMMGQFADRMCACEDTVCAQATHKDMMNWVKQHFKGGKKKGTKRTVDLWKKAQQKLNRCYIDVMKAGLKKRPDSP